MVKVITQETFDLVVKENVEEFGMEIAEAVKDAKEQFEKQGINLGNIVISEQGSQVVVKAVQGLFKNDELLENMKVIQECCRSDLPSRVLATDNGAYSILVKLGAETQSDQVKLEVVRTLVTVMDTNPDMLESQGIDIMNKILSERQSEEQTEAGLELVLVCSVKCEQNRVALIQNGILINLVSCMTSPSLVIRVCKVWVALVQDDDVRVPFGKAHENAREIVENHEALKVLTKCLKTHSADVKVLEECLNGLRSLAVRNEYCQEVEDQGGLQFLHQILTSYPEVPELLFRSLQVLKALAGNDKVKTSAGRVGLLPLVVTSMDRHVTRPGLVEAGCGALTALTLRQEDNSRQVVTDCDGAVVLTLVMARHPANRRVQSGAAAAIRNIVSRNKELCLAFTERDVEQLLTAAMEHHGAHIGDTLRSAQRDLGLRVDLVESWTGDKIKIKQDFRETEEINE